MELNELIANLVQYAKRNLELDGRDEAYTYNALLDLLGGSGEPCAPTADYETPDILTEELSRYAVEHKLVSSGEEADLCDKVMAALSLRPSEVDEKFSALLKKSSKAATDWLYAYCVKNDSVKKGKLDKNPRFDVDGLTITVNKSKPEFRDPKKAKAGNSVAGGYPKCVICRENEGFAPRGKRTLRTVSIRLGGEDFFWQYSPYGYFREHGIAVNKKHIPMFVDESTFAKLMDFVDIFPHYFIGCNAPLPRIGGSVLAHDHFQGGGEILPLHRAKAAVTLRFHDFPQTLVEIPEWQGTVVRAVGKNREEIIAFSERVRRAWVGYSDPARGIIASDNEGVHNAVSPTVFKTERGYEMNLILRCNITSKEYPDGVFHAHPEFHAIKKESIGLIEAQGLFILPGRLEEQLARVIACVEKGKLDADLEEFSLVYEETKALTKGDAREAMRQELGSVCRRILSNTAVFKRTEETVDFLKGVGEYAGVRV